MAPVAARAANAEYERRAASAATLADAQRLLRHWRRREMLRIAWRDIAGPLRCDETLRDVSALGGRLHPRRRRRRRRAHLAVHFRDYRAPSRGAEAPLIVLGMGKLGGRELNFSSDVDLVFLFADAGETDGPRSSTTRTISIASDASSSACSMPGRRMDSSFESTCACARSATADLWS